MCQSTGKAGTGGSLSAVLGRKGKPRDEYEAMTTTNPNYNTGEPKWRKNCQRCVWAYEMQRRGYDVEALPRDLSGNDTLPYIGKNGWNEVVSGGVLETVSPSGRNVERKLAEKMYEYGDGARAIVRVTWAHGRSGHVFIAEQQNGGTIFLDPQSGHYVDIHEYIGNSKKRNTQIMRVDHLTPTALLEKCVQKRTKGK